MLEQTPSAKQVADGAARPSVLGLRPGDESRFDRLRLAQ